jgi:hypothetical protein
MNALELIEKCLARGEDVTFVKDADGYWGQLWQGGVEMGVEIASGSGRTLEELLQILDDSALKYYRFNPLDRNPGVDD